MKILLSLILTIMILAVFATPCFAHIIAPPPDDNTTYPYKDYPDLRSDYWLYGPAPNYWTLVPQTADPDWPWCLYDKSVRWMLRGLSSPMEDK